MTNKSQFLKKKNYGYKVYDVSYYNLIRDINAWYKLFNHLFHIFHYLFHDFCNKICTSYILRVFIETSKNKEILLSELVPLILNRTCQLEKERKIG